MNYATKLLPLALMASIPLAFAGQGQGQGAAKAQAHSKAKVHANPNAAHSRVTPVAAVQPVAGVAVGAMAGMTAQEHAAMQGAGHGKKGSAGVTYGIEADAKGRFDFNGDGLITQDEVEASNRVRAAVNSGQAGPKFKAIDLNADGVLSLEELQGFRASINRPTPVNLGLRANALGQFDFNSDGTISAGEILASTQVQAAVKNPTGSAFVAIDTNVDGNLSAAELIAYAATL